MNKPGVQASVWSFDQKFLLFLVSRNSFKFSVVEHQHNVLVSSIFRNWPGL